VHLGNQITGEFVVPLGGHTFD